MKYYSRNEKLASKWRNNLTPPESKLWEHLSKGIKDYSFRAQEPLLNWVVDFYSPELNFAIEVDGNWHNSSTNKRRDKEKDKRLWEEAGVLVLRIGAAAIFHDFYGVVERINTAIDNLKNLDNKSPLLRYKAKTTKFIQYSPEEKAKLIESLEKRGRIEKIQHSPC